MYQSAGHFWILARDWNHTTKVIHIIYSDVGIQFISKSNVCVLTLLLWNNICDNICGTIQYMNCH